MNQVANPLSQRILDVARSCSDLFTACLSKDPDAFSRLEAQERRFWVWSSNLKVFAQRHVNLDTQLRQEKHAQIREMVLLLLSVLKDNLSLALKSIPPREESKRDPLAVPLFGIDGSLKRLETVAAAIHHATQPSLTRRVLDYAKRQDDYSEITRTFTMTILARYRGLVPGNTDIIIDPKLLPSPDEVMKPKPRGLFHSLVKSSVIRHYRIAYERHKIRNVNQEPIPELAAEEHDAPRESDFDGDKSEPIRPTSREFTTPEESQPSKPSDETQSESQTQPLSIQLTMFKEKFGEEASNYEHRAGRPPASEAGQASYPRAPKISDGQTEATCPICRKILPADDFEGESWISHVDKDIKPFVCISESCMSNLQYFENSASWIDHMHKKHTTHWVRYLHNAFVWNCPACREVSTTEFASKDEVEEELVKHMSNHHSDAMEVSDLRSMAGLSVVPQHRPLDICPICGEQHEAQVPLAASQVADDIESEDEDPVQTTKSLGSIKKKKELAFDVPPESQSKKQLSTHETELDPVSQSQSKLTKKRTRLTKVEKCIRGHLKALAFYFSNRLIDDEDVDDIEVERKSISVSRRSEDSRLVDLESLSSVESNDPPAFPEGFRYDQSDSEDLSTRVPDLARQREHMPNISVYNEKTHEMYAAVLSHGNQEWNLIASHVVKRRKVELVDRHTTLIWRTLSSNDNITTKFFLDESDEFEFKLGWAGNELGEEAELKRVIARNLKELRDHGEWDTTGRRVPNPKLSQEEMDRFYPDISCQSRNSPELCRGGRVDGMRYCTLHKCLDDDCEEEAQVPGGYCQAYHSCLTPLCQNTRLGNTPDETKYCSEHKCVDSSCKEEALAPGGFCPYHGCEIDGCQDRRSGKNATTTYCFRHKCLDDSCGKQAQVPGGFCRPYHACAVDGCLNGRSDNSVHTVYCTMHQCKIQNCRRMAKSLGSYCLQEHACWETSCQQRRGNAFEGRYCAMHECKRLKCIELAQEPTGYCEKFHACMSGAGNCMERRADHPPGTTFCITHKCNNHDCPAESRDPGGYCLDLHSCDVVKCKNRRVGSDGPEHLCYKHYIERVGMLPAPEKGKENEEEESLDRAALVEEVVKPIEPVLDPLIVEDDDEWESLWGTASSKKDKKKKKKGESTYAGESIKPDAIEEPKTDDIWGTAFSKKDKNGKGTQNMLEDVTGPTPEPEMELEEKEEEDEWGSAWGTTSKKDKKKGKKAIEAPPPTLTPLVMDLTEPEENLWEFGTEAKKTISKDLKDSKTSKEKEKEKEKEAPPAKKLTKKEQEKADKEEAEAKKQAEEEAAERLETEEQAKAKAEAKAAKKKANEEEAARKKAKEEAEEQARIEAAELMKLEEREQEEEEEDWEENDDEEEEPAATRLRGSKRKKKKIGKKTKKGAGCNPPKREAAKQTTTKIQNQ